MSDLLARDGLRLEAQPECLVVCGEVGFEHAAELAEAGSRLARAASVRARR